EQLDEWTCAPIDPFQYMTLPQTLQALFIHGLPTGQDIAAVPRIPKIKQRQSQKALQWMLSCQMDLREKYDDPDLQIRHVYNSPQGREHYVGLPGDNYQALDGYVRTDDKEYFFQFHGCYWHGCPECFPNEQENRHPHRNVPYKQL